MQRVQSLNFNKLCVGVYVWNRYGYFGKDKPEVLRLLLCNVSGCSLTYISANEEEVVSINTREQAVINMLKKEEVKVILA